MYKCKVCEREFENRYSYLGHCSSHKRGDSYREKRRSDTSLEKKIKSEEKIKTCHYCGLQFDNGLVLGGHLIHCPGNPNSGEIRNKIGKANRGKTLSEESKQKIKNGMRKAVLENPDSYSKSNVSGRVKLYEYKGTKLKGKWELDTAKWFDKKNIKWTNDIEPFEYFWDGGIHHYFPDFYLEDYNLYIEVKGFPTERDYAKWSVVENLLVLQKEDIQKIRNDSYILKKKGETFSEVHSIITI